MTNSESALKVQCKFSKSIFVLHLFNVLVLTSNLKRNEINRSCWMPNLQKLRTDSLNLLNLEKSSGSLRHAAVTQLLEYSTVALES